MPTPKGGSSPRRSRLALVPKGAKAAPPRRPKPPEPPEDLDDGAKEAWHAIVSIPEIAEVLTPADLLLLRILATKLRTRRDLDRTLLERGKVSYTSVTDGGGEMHRSFPELAALDRIDARIESLLGRFGMSPADRTRTTRQLGAARKADPIDEFADD